MNISDRIKAIRKEANLKQDEFADKLGLNKNTVGRWERGEQKPNYEDLSGILQAYPEVNPTWLLTGEGPMVEGGECPEEVAMRNRRTYMGSKFRAIRGDKSIDDFCKQINYISGLWWEYEENLRDPSWFMLSKLCNELGINPSWLLEDEGPMLKKDVTISTEPFIDKLLIKNAIQAVEEYLSEVKGTLSLDKKAELIMLLCEWHLKESPEGKKINKATVIRLVKLAA